MQAGTSSLSAFDIAESGSVSAARVMETSLKRGKETHLHPRGFPRIDVRY
jgi:hypothetical protein